MEQLLESVVSARWQTQARRLGLTMRCERNPGQFDCPSKLQPGEWAGPRISCLERVAHRALEPEPFARLGNGGARNSFRAQTAAGSTLGLRAARWSSRVRGTFCATSVTRNCIAKYGMRQDSCRQRCNRH